MKDLQVRRLIQQYLKGRATIDESCPLKRGYKKQSTAFKRPDQQMIDKNQKLVLKFLESRFIEKRKFLPWPIITIAYECMLIIVGTYVLRSTFISTNSSDIDELVSTITPRKKRTTLTQPIKRPKQYNSFTKFPLFFVDQCLKSDEEL